MHVNIGAFIRRPICPYWVCAGADRDFRGGSNNYIHKRGRVREGACPSRNSKGVWGSADSSPSGSWFFAPAAFLHLRLFSMKINILLIVISPQNNLILITTYTNGITIISKHNIRKKNWLIEACLDSDEKTGSYCSAIQLVTRTHCDRSVAELHAGLNDNTVLYTYL